MIEDLLLIGTNHDDRLGPFRLKKILDWYNPTIISIECTQKMYNKSLHAQKNLDFAKGNLYLQKESLGLSDEIIKSLLAVSTTAKYELRIARNYSQENDVLVVPVETIESRKNTENDGSSDSQKLVPLVYDQYELDFSYFDPIILSSKQENILLKRDEVMASNIRKLSGRVAHISGLAHIFAHYNNLYSQLSDLNPRRMILYQADELNKLKN